MRGGKRRIEAGCAEVGICRFIDLKKLWSYTPGIFNKNSEAQDVALE
jgi:hypothetical protein